MSLGDRIIDAAVLVAALFLVVLRFGTEPVDRMAPKTAFYALAHRPESAGPYDVAVTTNIEYSRAGHVALFLDIYRPIDAPSPRPGVIAIHPGGWNNFAKSTIAGISRTLASHGFVVAALDYRLSPAARWPACLEDCKEAVRWLRSHALQYGVDPDQLAAIGDSAGGHLSLMLAVTSPEDGFEGTTRFPGVSSAIQAAVSYYGPTDLADTLDFDRPGGTMVTLLGGTLRDRPDLYAKASPLSYAGTGDAPVMMVHGKKDVLVPFRHATRMAEALRLHDVPAEVIGVENADHALLRKGGPLAPDLASIDRAVVAFLRERLKAHSVVPSAP